MAHFILVHCAAHGEPVLFNTDEILSIRPGLVGGKQDTNAPCWLNLASSVHGPDDSPNGFRVRECFDAVCALLRMTKLLR